MIRYVQSDRHKRIHEGPRASPFSKLLREKSPNKDLATRVTSSASDFISFKVSVLTSLIQNVLEIRCFFSVVRSLVNLDLFLSKDFIGLLRAASHGLLIISTCNS